MSRGVGGASAVGCGVFGLGSLIIGIGLTVWLGSTVMSSTGGGGPKTKSTSQVSTLTSTLDEVAPPPVPGLEPSGATLKASKGLGEEGTVAVTGESLSRGALDLSTCLASSTSGFEVAGCDPSTTVAAKAGGDGRLGVDYPIHRVITVSGIAYDCAARPGACSVYGHRPDNPLDSGLTAPLVFATGLPPVDAVAPPQG